MYFLPSIFGICIVVYFIRGFVLNQKFKRTGKPVKGIVSDVIREGRAAYLFVSFTDENGNEISGTPKNLKFGTLGYRRGSKVDVCYNPDASDSFIVGSNVQAIFQIGGILFGILLVGLGIFFYLHH